MWWAALLALCGCGRLSFDAFRDGDAGLGDGAVADDAGDAGSQVACNLGARVYDDFAGAQLDMDTWGGSYMNPGTTVGVTTGDLVITPATNGGMAYAGARTYRLYDLRDSRFSAEVVQVGSSLSVTGIQVEYDAGTYFSVSHYNGNLRAAYRYGSYMSVGTTPYLAGQHNYWGMSEQGGTLYFETSADGVTFTPFAQLSPPVELALVRVIAYAGTDTNVAAPGQARFARVGTASGASGGACPASSIVETFTSTQLPHRWDAPSQDACCAYQLVSGRLRMTTDGTTGNVHVRTAAGIDLRGDAVRVELVSDPSAANTHASLLVRRDTQNYYELHVGPTSTVARMTVNGTPSNITETRNPAERFLRLSEAAGTLYWTVSTDGTTWRELRAVTAPPIPVDDVVALLRLETALASTADSVELDNFNVP